MPTLSRGQFGYTVLSDPLGKARSQRHFDETYNSGSVDLLTSTTYGAFLAKPQQQRRRSSPPKMSRPSSASGVDRAAPPVRASARRPRSGGTPVGRGGLRERPRSSAGVSSSRSHSSGDSFFDRRSSSSSSSSSRRCRPEARGSRKGSITPASGKENDGPVQWSPTSQRTESCASATEPRWKFATGGWVQKPKLRTRRELLQARKEALLPDKSFDVDGDGVVSAADYHLSSQFDVNKDGFIDKDERAQLRKAMVQSLIHKYTAAPKAESAETRNLINKFTRDLDRTVERDSFVHDFNELYNKTAMTQVCDSSQMFGVLCPRELARHEQKMNRVSKYQAGQVTPRTSRDVTHGEGVKVGADHTRWSGLGSRQEMLRQRRLERRDEGAARIQRHQSTHQLAPGHVRPTHPAAGHVRGPPGVRPSHHHRLGNWDTGL